jgi:uncharacterized protein (DUF2267 family)
MPEKMRRPIDGTTIQRRLAHDASKLAEPEEPANDLSDRGSGAPEEPGVAVGSTEVGVQFLRDAMEQYNFESQIRPEEDHEPRGAPAGQILSQATLESAGQDDFEVPVSAALADDQPETRDEPDEPAINLRSDAIVEASLFDRPVSDMPTELEERAAEDDFSVTFASPLRAPEIATDDPSDVDDSRERHIQRLFDERVKKRLQVEALPHEQQEAAAAGEDNRHSACSFESMSQENPQPRRARHAARASQTSHEAARVVRDVTGIEDDEAALRALEIVAGGIVRRVTPAEAGDFIAQLPSELQPALLDLRAGPDKGITLDTIAAELASSFAIEPDAAARMMRSVGVALRGLVSRGEIDDVLAQLPRDMRELLPDVVARPTP